MTLPVDLDNLLRRQVSLKSYTTYKIGGAARFFAEPATRDELIRLLEFRKSEGLSLLVIGRGSNLLISDAGFQGLALSLRRLEPVHHRVERHDCLIVSGGMSLARLAQITADESLAGAEFLCHIPGTVGGAIMMNAGFGRRGHEPHEIKDILESFTVLNLDIPDQLKLWRREEFVFDYRKTNIPSSAVILEARFRLDRKAGELVTEEIRANFAYRNAVQDLRYPSAGSTFKNPKTGAFTSGQLLDRVGMKGERSGGAMVSERHANFFLNVDHAFAHDVLTLMNLAKRRVFEQFGVDLEPEVRYVGSGSESESLFEAVGVR